MTVAPPPGCPGAPGCSVRQPPGLVEGGPRLAAHPQGQRRGQPRGELDLLVGLEAHGSAIAGPHFPAGRRGEVAAPVLPAARARPEAPESSKDFRSHPSYTVRAAATRTAGADSEALLACMPARSRPPEPASNLRGCTAFSFRTGMARARHPTGLRCPTRHRWVPNPVTHPQRGALLDRCRGFDLL